MRNNKKSRKNSNNNSLDTLRMILDKGTVKDLSPSEDEKYLKSLSKTLRKSIEENTVHVKIKSKMENNEENYSLKPKVTIHPRIHPKKEEKTEIKVEIKPLEKQLSEKERDIYRDEDFFEIEKIEISEPRFIEVKPKETVKSEKEKTVEKKAIADENLIEWKPVEEAKESIPLEKKVEEPVELGKPENTISKEITEKDVKIDAFKDLKSIDDETAVLLYNHGFTSIDALSIASIKDLTHIGIKRRQAKKIKKEIKEKIEWKPWEYEEEARGEESESTEKEKIVEFEPIFVGETAEGEVTEEQIEKEEKIGYDEVKYDVFKDLKSVDEETAVLLYDNGYTSVDDLKNATVKDLIRIKGIRRSVAKKIIKEINKKLEESVKVKPIDVDDSAKGEVSGEELEEEFKEEVIEEGVPAPVELSRKSSEWKPVSAEETISKEITEKDVKIDAFKDLKSIDDETAVLLYNHGFTSIDALSIASIKDLTHIGIKRRQAKKIKKEIEERFIEEESKKNQIVDKEFSSEYFIEDEEDFGESKELDEKILEHVEPIEKHMEEFLEEEIEEDIPVIEKEDKNVDIDMDVFKNIPSIDDKIAKLLIDNGIISIELLKSKTIKELTKIKGIRRKIAKQIKKEVKELSEKNESTENVTYERDENPYIQEDEEEEWESFDEDKVSEEKIEEFKGFKYGDYTLYEREIETKDNKKQVVRFFSKAEPEGARPIELPEGYEVKENAKTGVPYLKKKKKQ